MSDEILREQLQLIHSNIDIVLLRFASIHKATDFTETEEGLLILDAICMRLQSVGELVKKILKEHPEIETNFPTVSWDSIIQFRDFISHHYEKLDYEVVFDICKNDIAVLDDAISKLTGNN